MDVTIRYKGELYARPVLEGGKVLYKALAARADGRWGAMSGMSQHSHRPSLRTAMGMEEATDAEFVAAVDLL